MQKELLLIPNWRISRIDVHLKSQDDLYKNTPYKITIFGDCTTEKIIINLQKRDWPIRINALTIRQANKLTKQPCSRHAQALTLKGISHLFTLSLLLLTEVHALLTEEHKNIG